MENRDNDSPKPGAVFALYAPILGFLVIILMFWLARVLDK